MTTMTCPTCSASLPSWDSAACPFCLNLNSSPSSASESEAVPLTPLPYNSAIRIWEATANCRVFHLHRGRGGFLGFFAVCWLAFVLFMTANLISGRGNKDNDLVMGLLAMSAFWLAGFGMLFAHVRQRFLKTIILLERQRLVIQRNLFGWKSVEETSLAGVSAADLVVAYEENYKPVFAVRVCGVERKIQFGAALEIADKNWLVDEINGFLSRHLPGSASSGDSSAELRDADDDALETILQRAGVSIVHADDETTQLSGSAFELPFAGRLAVAVISAGFAGMWYAGIGVWLLHAVQVPFPMNIAFALFSIPFLIGGLLPIAVAAMALWGVIRVEIGPEVISCRYSAGPFGLTRSLRTSSIDRVNTGNGVGEDNPRWKSRPASAVSTCTIHAGTKSIALRVVATPPSCHALAELVRRRLAFSDRASAVA